MTAMPFNLKKLRQESFLHSIEYFESIESTNTAALNRVQAQPDLNRVLVLTANQTAGRGRGNHRWHASEGALTFSLIKHFPGLTGNALARIGLATGIAVSKALEKLTNLSIQLKWPNDIFLQNRKLGGILIETSQASPQTLVIGIGININNSLAHQDTPNELTRKSISLIDAIGTTQLLTDVLLAILAELDDFYEQVIAKTVDIPAAWNPRCMFKGSEVDFVQGDYNYQGVCLGVQTDGALLLRIDGEIKPFYSGSVVL